MPDLIKIIGTVIMILLLVYALAKKKNVVSTLFLLGVAGVTAAALLTGASPVGEETTGNIFLDVFESIYGIFQSQLSGNALVITSVMAYVSYMEQIKASKIFGAVCSKPLQKIKNKYIVVFFAVIIGGILKMVIPSGIGTAALLVAIIYPILKSIGISTATSATVIVIGYAFGWGVANPFYLMQQSMAPIKMDLMTYFMQYNTPLSLLLFLVVALTIVITSKYFDRKEQEGSGNKAVEAVNLDDVEVPMFFGFLPILPLLLCVIFSSLVVKTIVISVPAANILSFIAAYILNYIFAKDKGKAYNDIAFWFTSMGRCLGSVASIIIASAIFASGISAFGGMQVLFDKFASGSNGYLLILVVGALLAYGMVIITGSLNGTTPMFMSMYGELMTGGIISETQLLSMFTAMTNAANFGCAVTPVAAAMVFVSNSLEISVPEIIKRTIIPSVVGVAVSILVSIIL